MSDHEEQCVEKKESIPSSLHPIAAKMPKTLRMVKLGTILPTWPQVGNHILAQCDYIHTTDSNIRTPSTVVVYQAFNKGIADHAVAHQQFITGECPGYNSTRMTWIKTNFLWMMYRCGWCSKDANQDRVLAIKLKSEGFDEILRVAKCVHGAENNLSKSDPVRLQWDPDHDPSGGKCTRRAIQLGIRGPTQLSKFRKDWIVSIEDITDTVVVPQRELACRPSQWSELLVPEEGVYTPSDSAVCDNISLSKMDIS